MSAKWILKYIFDSPFQLEDLKLLEDAFQINQAAEFIWFTQAWLDEAFLAHQQKASFFGMKLAILCWQNQPK